MFPNDNYRISDVKSAKVFWRPRSFLMVRVLNPEHIVLRKFKKYTSRNRPNWYHHKKYLEVKSWSEKNNYGTAIYTLVLHIFVFAIFYKWTKSELN